MEFHRNEGQQEEMGNPVPASYESLVKNSGFSRMTISSGGEGSSVTARRSGGQGVSFRYKECLKNHAIGLGGNSIDGCCEFLAAGDDGTLAALTCAACNCHRNFHRKEVDGEILRRHHPPVQHHSAHAQYTSPHYRAPVAGYLHHTPQVPHHHRPLALQSSSDGERDGHEQENMSNPSSSGGAGGSKKRYRTKFTREQKDKMLEFAERLGWRIQKHDEDAVQQFCQEVSIKRHVLKVWMHNNKHTLGKKP